MDCFHLFGCAETRHLFPLVFKSIYLWLAKPETGNGTCVQITEPQKPTCNNSFDFLIVLFWPWSMLSPGIKLIGFRAPSKQSHFKKLHCIVCLIANVWEYVFFFYLLDVWKTRIGFFRYTVIITENIWIRSFENHPSKQIHNVFNTLFYTRLCFKFTYFFFSVFKFVPVFFLFC